VTETAYTIYYSVPVWRLAQRLCRLRGEQLAPVRAPLKPLLFCRQTEEEYDEETHLPAADSVGGGVQAGHKALHACTSWCACSNVRRFNHILIWTLRLRVHPSLLACFVGKVCLHGTVQMGAHRRLQGIRCTLLKADTVRSSAVHNLCT